VIRLHANAGELLEHVGPGAICLFRNCSSHFCGVAVVAEIEKAGGTAEAVGADLSTLDGPPQRVALVTGGSRGIGADIVRRLIQQKMGVAFTYSNASEKAEALATESKVGVAERLPSRQTATLSALLMDTHVHNCKKNL